MKVVGGNWRRSNWENVLIQRFDKLDDGKCLLLLSPAQIIKVAMFGVGANLAFATSVQFLALRFEFQDIPQRENIFGFGVQKKYRTAASIDMAHRCELPVKFRAF